MALKVFDRVQETTSTSGTGTITLAGASSGYRTFTSVLSNADTTYYTIVDGTAWETGLGTFTTSGTTLARTTVLASSNSGSAINLSGGASTIVFIDIPAALVQALIGGTAGNSILAGGASAAPTIGTAGASYVYTSTQSVTLTGASGICTGKTGAWFACWGAGGGGGGGGTIPAAGSGGASGAGGGFSGWVFYPTSALPSSVTVTVPAAGAHGGPGAGGSQGGAGVATSVVGTGIAVYAGPGGGGAVGASAATAVGGGSGANSNQPGSTGTTSAGTGAAWFSGSNNAAGTPGNSNSFATGTGAFVGGGGQGSSNTGGMPSSGQSCSCTIGGPGGGSGGSIQSAASVANTGMPGGICLASGVTTQAANGAPTATNGTAATGYTAGNGGGGGDASLHSTAGTGGNGGLPGGGGGGGGSTVDGTRGSGGDGGAALVAIIVVG